MARARPCAVLVCAAGLLGATSAHAGDGTIPRTPVVFPAGECMMLVEKAAEDTVHLDYGIKVLDICVTPDEVEGSRSHQFFGLCKQTDVQTSMPNWITQADIDTAKQSGIELEQPPADDILESHPDFVDCWERLNADDDRYPITCGSADAGVDWNIVDVPAGAYAIHGYTWHPRFNIWRTRKGVIKLVDGDPEMAAPAAAIMNPEEILYKDDVLVVDACVHAVDGSTATAYWSVTDSDTMWNEFITDEPVLNGDVELVFDPPEEHAGGSPLMLRLDITDPMDRTYSAYGRAGIVVLGFDNPQGGCDTEDSSGFIGNPNCETDTEGGEGDAETLGPEELDYCDDPLATTTYGHCEMTGTDTGASGTTASTSDGTGGTSGAQQTDSGGCSCTTQAGAGSWWALLGLVPGLRRRRRVAPTKVALAAASLAAVACGPTQDAPAPGRDETRWKKGATWEPGRIPGRTDREQLTEGEPQAYSFGSWDVEVKPADISAPPGERLLAEVKLTPAEGQTTEPFEVHHGEWMWLGIATTSFTMPATGGALRAHVIVPPTETQVGVRAGDEEIVPGPRVRPILGESLAKVGASVSRDDSRVPRGLNVAAEDRTLKLVYSLGRRNYQDCQHALTMDGELELQRVSDGHLLLLGSLEETWSEECSAAGPHNPRVEASVDIPEAGEVRVTLFVRKRGPKGQWNAASTATISVS